MSVLSIIKLYILVFKSNVITRANEEHQVSERNQHKVGKDDRQFMPIKIAMCDRQFVAIFR